MAASLPRRATRSRSTCLIIPRCRSRQAKWTRHIDVQLEPGYVARNDADVWCQGLYDLETMHGHHIGIQIVGRRFEEEKVLGAAQQIERLTSLPAK